MCRCCGAIFRTILLPTRRGGRAGLSPSLFQLFQPNAPQAYVFSNVPDVSGAPPPSTDASLNCASAFAIFKLAAVFSAGGAAGACPFDSTNLCRRSAPFACEMPLTAIQPPRRTRNACIRSIGRSPPNFIVIRKILSLPPRLSIMSSDAYPTTAYHSPLGYVQTRLSALRHDFPGYRI